MNRNNEQMLLMYFRFASSPDIFRCNQLLYGMGPFWKYSTSLSKEFDLLLILNTKFIWSFKQDREVDREPDSRNEENHVCGRNQLLYGMGPFWKYSRSLSKELDLLLILNISTHFIITFRIGPVSFLPRK